MPKGVYERTEEHKRKLKQNSPFKKGYTPWNKRLTKETDEKLREIGKNISLVKKGEPSPLKGRKFPEEEYPNKGMRRKKHSTGTRKKMAKKKEEEWKDPDSTFNSKEYRKKLSDMHLGQEAWNEGLFGSSSTGWKGGITELSALVRSCKKYIKWRIKVFKRDNFTCQDCGDEKGGNLNAHHKKSFSIILKENKIKSIEEAINCKEIWDINNGVTLCKRCHRKLKKNKIK